MNFFFYEVKWGKVDGPAHTQLLLDRTEALELVREKRAKGMWAKCDQMIAHDPTRINIEPRGALPRKP